MLFIRLTLTAIIGLLPVLGFSQAVIKEITTRPGVTIKFTYVKAENAVASALLLPGGSGVSSYNYGGTVYETYFPKALNYYTQQGINVLMPEIPSDRSSLNNFRNSAEHAQDNAALMAYLKQQSNAPVWVIGHSNGALSAASLSAQLQDKGPVGVVLMSSTTKAPFGISAAHPVLQAALDQIKVPVLVVHNKNDPCPANPYSGVALITSALKAAKKVDHIAIEGGTSSQNACYGIHGYLGIEEPVTKQVTDWIKANQPVEVTKSGN